MAWLDQLVDFNPRLDPNKGQAFASVFPAYEMQTPQYPFPNPYTLAQYGYRRNEIIYACINKRAKAIAEASLVMKDNSGVKPEALPDHPLRKLVANPVTLEDGSVKMTEKSFWRITETYLCIAGFAAWEIEYNNLGQPINLWTMRPDWCSFRRGAGNPLEYVRYQPYGLPFKDIPANRILLFQYFDPIYPLLKALSPSAVSSRVMTVDNATTDFLQLFFQRGAVINGLLKTEQSIGETESRRIRALWKEEHGGIANWGDPAVLGHGISYQPTQMNFREMQFDSVDGRSGERICQVFEIPPMLIGAKVGLNASTYSNFKEARGSWYEEWVSPEWDWLDSEVESQLAPKFDPAKGKSFIVEFDTSRVRAMQEDEDLKHARAREDAKANLITRDEAREIIGRDPKDNADVYVGQGAPSEMSEEIIDITPEPAAIHEQKQFKQFSQRMLEAGTPERIQQFRFKHLPTKIQRQLIGEALHGDNDDFFQSDDGD